MSVRVRVRVMKLRCILSYSFERLLFHGLKNKDSFTFIRFYKFVPVIEVWYFLTDQLLFMGVALKLRCQCLLPCNSFISLIISQYQFACKIKTCFVYTHINQIRSA